jgi:O-antigen/teichoic acid export membrane protein
MTALSLEIWIDLRDKFERQMEQKYSPLAIVTFVIGIILLFYSTYFMKLHQYMDALGAFIFTVFVGAVVLTALAAHSLLLTKFEKKIAGRVHLHSLKRIAELSPNPQ